MTGLIAIEDRLAFQRLLEFLARRIHRLARFFPGRLPEGIGEKIWTSHGRAYRL